MSKSEDIFGSMACDYPHKTTALIIDDKYRKCLSSKFQIQPSLVLVQKHFLLALKVEVVLKKLTFNNWKYLLKNNKYKVLFAYWFMGLNESIIGIYLF